MGCGRVGANLATELDEVGHSVAVVDQDANSFSRLPDSFAGTTVKGVGFDRDTLIRAGINRASAFAAVSSGDNSNIIAARVAKETFNIKRVVARIYDPRRAEIYERLGIPTVATVAWSTAEILHRMMPEAIRAEWQDPTGKFGLGEVEFHPAWCGLSYRRFELLSGTQVVTVSRYGTAHAMHPDLVIQQDDRCRIVFALSATEQVAELVSHAPEELS